MGLKRYATWDRPLLTLPAFIARVGIFRRTSCAVPVFRRFFLTLCGSKVKHRSITLLALSAMPAKIRILSKNFIKVYKWRAYAVGSLLSICNQENASPKKLKRLFVLMTNFCSFSRNIRSKAHG